MILPLPEGVQAIRPPLEAELLAIAEDACARGLFLITDGRDTILSPRVLPGWHRLGVTLKEVA